MLEYKHHDLADDGKDEKKIYRGESRAARAVKLSASRTSQHQRKFLPAVQAKSPQLAASQLPNLFSRVNQQHSAQRSTSGVCFACGKPGHWRACSPSLQQFNTAQSSKWLADVVSTTFAIHSFRIDHLRIKIFFRILVSRTNLLRTRIACRWKADCVGHFSWREINAPQSILDVIEFGYNLPLLQTPTPFSARNNSSALEHSAFVVNVISDLTEQGCVYWSFLVTYHHSSFVRFYSEIWQKASYFRPSSH